MYCTKCGEKIDDNVSWCQKCGQPLQGDTPPPLPVKASGFPIWAIILIVGVVVIFFLGIVAAIAIPSLLRSRMSANEAAAIGGLKTIAAGQTDYNNNSMPHTYTGALACLGSGQGAGGVRFIDPNLAQGLKSGYTYHMVAGNSVNGSMWSWSATAWPVTYQSTGVRSFYIDESGVILGEDIGGGMGTNQMQSLY